MTGIRKTSKLNCLVRLYQRKGLPFNMREIQELSTKQMDKEIARLRGSDYKKVNTSRERHTGGDITV